MAAYSAKRGEVVACGLDNFMSLANNLYDRVTAEILKDAAE